MTAAGPNDAAFMRALGASRDRLRVLAVCRRPLNRTLWAELCAACNVRNGSRAISSFDLGNAVTGWSRAGLLDELGKDEYALPAALRHQCLIELRSEGLLDGWVAAWGRVSNPHRTSLYWLPPDLHLAAAQAHLYAGRIEELRATLEAYRHAQRNYTFGSAPALLELMGWDSVADALELLPLDLAEQYLSEVAERATSGLLRLRGGARTLALTRARSPELVSRLVVYAALSSEPELLEPLLASLVAPLPEVSGARALAALTRGQLEEARAFAQHAAESFPSTQRMQLRWLSHPATPWVYLLLATSPLAAQVELGLMPLPLGDRGRTRLPHAFVYRMVQQFRRHVDGGEGFHLDSTLVSGLRGSAAADGWLELTFAALCSRWVVSEGDLLGGARFDSLVRHAEQQGFAWLAAELALLGDRLGKARERVAESALLALYQRRPAWEGTLSALERLLDGKGGAPLESERRLVWEVEPGPVPQLHARLQTKTASGHSRGKRLSPKQLAEAREQGESWISEQDRQVLRHLVRDREPGVAERFLFAPEAYAALVDHPYVTFVRGSGSFIKVVKRPPRLVVREDAQKSALEVSLVPEECADGRIVLVQDSEDTLIVHELDASLVDVARTLARGVSVPQAGRQRLTDLMGKLSAKFDVLSDVAGTGLEEVAADERIHVRLWRGAAGMRGRLVVQPLPGKDRAFVPGVGQATLVFELAGKSFQTHRALVRESEDLERLLESCPALAAAEKEGDDFVVRDVATALEILLELRAQGDDVVVHWPEGAPLSVVGERKTRDLRLSIGTLQDLLTLDGEIQVSETVTLQMRELLLAVQQAQGRFIALGQDQFVALEQSLLTRLQQVAAVADTKSGRTELSPALVPLLSSWLAESEDPSVTDAVRGMVERLNEASALVPELPEGLHAELRPYQREGFTWLCRLAHWGAGACLSDDMGLGKTLQVLALLLRRAPSGPALVVAPMSVCQGWIDEAQRFTPALRLSRWTALERTAQLDALKPFDVLVCSYGVMQNEIDTLSAIEFETVVVDEAQAIKNVGAQRTKAARRLRGRFRIATSGTPIENHLGELWSIMSFTNPGLLGSRQRFEDRFARRIAIDHDPLAADQLRRLVAPFLLRRLKRDVLSELPAKTEISLSIELGEEERALYEGIRQKALKALAQPSTAGAQRLRVLAELMRLRRAACHPELVAPGSGIASSKLAALKTLVEELRDGGHKALVFSQFVDHLEQVRLWLEEAGIDYQYLVGATPEKDRARAIQDFQSGQGDLFLISLKAGGFGLNLTAADYVVILDPWWNPAAEDQAADRAHRIGQQRPVTVYRLVARATVEERIVALHEKKRNLADSLLDGMSDAVPLDLDALRELFDE
jgi:SNF2 domain-containing protein/helicase-like protein